MSKLPRIGDPADAALADVIRRLGDVERVLQQLEGGVSPFDGGAQPGMFADGTIGGGDIGAGQITGAHIQSLGIVGLLNSSDTTLQGDTVFGSGATAVLASGVSTPITAPGVALATGGAFPAGQTWYVSYTWSDGVHETTPFTPPPHVVTTVTGNAIQVTLPIAPVGATQANIYLHATTFGGGGGEQQTPVAVSTTAPTVVLLTALSGNGAASPSVSSTGFASTVARIEPASGVDSAGNAYGWTLEGNGRARFVGPTINSQFWLYDDFFYPASAYPGTGAATVFGAFTTVTAGTSASVAAGTSLNTDPGVVQLATGTTTTGKAAVRTGPHFGYGIARLRFSVYFMVDTAPNGTNTYQIIMGITSQGGSGTGAGHMVAGDSGVVFQFLADNAGPSLVLVTGNGTTITTSTGVALTAGNWYFAEWEIDAGLTGVDWWVNGVKQTRQTATLPGAGTAVKQLYLGIEKTATGAGTASRTLNVDTVALFGDYVSG